MTLAWDALAEPRRREILELVREREVRLSDLFGQDHDTLVLYRFMYGPQMQGACPSCTSILDSLDGAAPHLTQRLALAVVAESPEPRIRAFAAERGWRNLRLLSSAGNDYNRDYHGQAPDGSQTPMLNVFTAAAARSATSGAPSSSRRPASLGRSPATSTSSGRSETCST